MWRTKSLGRISHFDAEFCQRIITATVQLGFFALATATLNLEKAGTSASVDRVTSCPPYWLLPKQYATSDSQRFTADSFRSKLVPA
jgi:hypothetical protein